MSAFHDNALMGASGSQGYTISRSVRLRSSASAYFNRTPAGAGSQTTWTWSGWVKRGTLGSTYNLLQAETSSSTYTVLQFSSDNLIFDVRNGGAVVGNKYTTAVYRDPSAWYHIVFVWDTTNATASDRMRVYVNGVRVTAFGTSNDPSSSAVSYGLNGAVQHRLGAGVTYSNYFDGYLTEINFIDGQALTPSSFGETDAITGVWKPKKYAGTYGTNGFYLNFSDNSSNTATTIGKDYSGNGNNWTPNNISVTSGVTYDSMIDSPTVSAASSNYAVLNPVANSGTLINGNLTTNAGDKFSVSTIGMTSGKWYCEVTVTTVGSESSMGLSSAPYSGSQPYVGGTATSWGYYSADGKKYNNATGATYGSTYTTGDVIGIAFDADNGTLTFYKNNTSQGSAYTGLTSGPYFFALEGRTSGTTNNCSINFGQQPFVYTPPTGFKALNTQNLPEPTIKRGNDYFDVLTRSGTGASVAISSYRFAPDFVWIKARTNAYYHKLLDKVRGANKVLSSNATDAESTETQGLMSFDANGYTLGSSSDSTVNNAGSGQTYVDWAWKAGGTSSSNTNGSITSTVSVNATAGFSVVTWTGTGSNATVGHGLGVAPSMIIVKDRTAARTGYQWPVWHSSLGGGTKALFLNVTDSTATDATYWNSTIPTSSVFSVGTWGGVNYSGDSFVAYCFAEVAGYSKFGSYTGNGSSDGPFIFCNFRPAFIMIKRTDTTGNWTIHDNKRLGYNGSSASKELYPNLSNAEGSDSMDQLSNGFKLRDTYSDVNASGGTYVYAAFSESPFKLSLAR